MKIVIIDSTLLGAIFDFDRGQPNALLQVGAESNPEFLNPLENLFSLSFCRFAFEVHF